MSIVRALARPACADLATVSYYSLHTARRGLLHFVLGKVGSAALGASFLLLTVRLLDPVAYGRYITVMAMAEMFYLVTGLGLSTVAQRYVAEYRLRAPANEFAALLRLQFRRRLVYSACGTGLLLLAWPQAMAWSGLALRQAQGRSAIAGEGGTVLVERARIHAAARLDLADFFARRHSIRQFSAEPVAAVLVAQAVAMAQKTPSVCNRESGMVHAAFEPGIKERLLALQNGNRGFGDQAGCVLVVTSRLDTFLSVGERYQGWIDGGMFAMSLVYALHSLGLGSCCLNWSVEPEADIALRRVGGIPDDQLVIMLLAVGHLPERLRVAQSPRRPLDDVLKIL